MKSKLKYWSIFCVKNFTDVSSFGQTKINRTQLITLIYIYNHIFNHIYNHIMPWPDSSVSQSILTKISGRRLFGLDFQSEGTLRLSSSGSKTYLDIDFLLWSIMLIIFPGKKIFSYCQKKCFRNPSGLKISLKSRWEVLTMHPQTFQLG